MRSVSGIKKGPEGHILAVRTGIEPVISSVTGRHVNRYTNAPDGADEGNRTLVSTLARSRSTIELHLHICLAKKEGFEPSRRSYPT